MGCRPMGWRRHLGNCRPPPHRTESAPTALAERALSRPRFVARGLGSVRGVGRQMLLHLVARTSARAGSLSAFPLAAHVWAALRKAFPQAVGAVLMPDHMHVIAACETPGDG